MFSLNESNKFMVYGSHVDLRKGVETLGGLVRLMHMSPTDGSVYVFLNRSRSRMKLLHWERGGYVIYYKRLEQGRISRKVFRSSEAPLFYSMRWGDELLLFMEGVYPSAARRKRFNIQ